MSSDQIPTLSLANAGGNTSTLKSGSFGRIVYRGAVDRRKGTFEVQVEFEGASQVTFLVQGDRSVAMHYPVNQQVMLVQ